MTTITTKGKIYRYSADKATWYFLTLTKKASSQVKELRSKHKGWGQVAVEVTLGSSVWKTSVFPSKEVGGYVLPIKASIRKKEKVDDGDVVKVKMTLTDRRS